MNPLATNLIRTYVPVLVGAVASFLVAHGVHVQPDQTAWAVAAMTGVFTSAYYTVVRVLEDRWPWIGSLFLLSKPAATLHVAGACPAELEDYGEGWPPAVDGPGLQTEGTPPGSADRIGPAHPAYQPPPDDYHYPCGPSGSQVVYDQEAQPAAPPDGVWVATEPVRPGPLRVRKADTGAIPVYRTPPGR